jgi:hypothetical protein
LDILGYYGMMVPTDFHFFQRANTTRCFQARKRELSRDDKTLKWLAQPKAKGGYDQSEGDRSPEKVLPGVFKK